MKIKKKNEYRAYKDSGDAAAVQQLKNKYRGKRCFIVGNGASLRAEDLDKLKNELTFACNRIYTIFPKTDWRPTFYIAEDVDGFREMIPEVQKRKLPHVVLNNKAKGEYAGENILWCQWGSGDYVVNRYNDKTIHISEDVSDHFSVGYTVTFSAIQLAIYMGVSEIYLIGVDFCYSVCSDKWGRLHQMNDVQTYFDGKERNGSYLNLVSTTRAYECAKEYCDAHGIKIYNATRGGKLEVFERRELDEVLAE